MTSGEVVETRHAANGDERKTAVLAKDSSPPKPAAVRLGNAASTRLILRNSHAVQAGFGTNQEKFKGHIPVILADGERHRSQRLATARFFSPKIVSSPYRPLMESLAEPIVDRIRMSDRAHLEADTMELAVGVAADIIGLTNSDRVGLARRLEKVFRGSTGGQQSILSRLLAIARQRTAALSFMLRDVQPAIKARRRAPGEDLISHLIEEGYTDTEILTECLVYAAAGMVTTREFIVVAAWHMLERPDLRSQFLSAEQGEQMKMLEEILRTEPVVGIITRRVTEKIDLPAGGPSLQPGTLVELDIRDANSESAMVGTSGNRIDFGRKVAEKHPVSMFSFGDGVHRCPGATVAMLESAIFLDRLMRLPGLRLEAGPKIAWVPGIAGYELVGAIVCCETR